MQNGMLVGLAIQIGKKHTKKCVDGSPHYRIKVSKARLIDR